MKISLLGCTVTFVVGWLIGSLCIFVLLTSLDKTSDAIHPRSSLSYHSALSFYDLNSKRDGNLKALFGSVVGSDYKSMRFSEQSTTAPVTSFDRINELFKSYHFPFISSTSWSSSWILHSLSGSGQREDDDSEENLSSVNKLFIFIDWPATDDHFTIHNYHSLQTLLATFPQSIVRCLLPVPVSSSQFMSEQSIPSSKWDEEHDRQKYTSILAKRQFQLYRKLGYDIDTLSTMDLNNKIFRLFTFGQSYRKKWFTEYRKVLRKSFMSNVDFIDNHNDHNDDEKEQISQGQHDLQHKNGDEGDHEDPLSKESSSGTGGWSLPPYHLLTYIRLTYLWKKGGIFMDFSFLFRSNPFHISDFHQGYYINSYCSSDLSIKDGSTAVYRPKSYDSWRDLHCFTSTLFLFRFPQDELLSCVLKKYDDEIFQVCIESDPFYGGAECILKAFHQCHAEKTPSPDDGNPSNGRHWFGRSDDNTLVERFRDDPLIAKNCLLRNVEEAVENFAFRENSLTNSSIRTNQSDILLIPRKDNPKEEVINKNLNAPIQSNTTDISTASPIISKSMYQDKKRLSAFNIDKASILWMGHLAWQGQWCNYPYPTYSTVELIVEPAKAVTHHHLKFLRRQIRIVEETLQQEVIDRKGYQIPSQNNNITLGSTVISRSKLNVVSSTRILPSHTCSPYASLLTLPDLNQMPSISLFSETSYRHYEQQYVEISSSHGNNSSFSTLTIAPPVANVLSQHLRGTHTKSASPSPSPSSNEVVRSQASFNAKSSVRSMVDCSPSLYMIGFKDTGSEILRKLLDGNPFILSGWSQVQSALFFKKVDAKKNSDVVGEENGSGDESVRSINKQFREFDNQFLGILSSFVMEDEIGCYNSATGIETLQHRSLCFPFIESMLPVAEKYSENDSLRSIPKGNPQEHIKYDKYSPSLIFHVMDSSLTYNMDPLTPYVIRQDNPHGKALFILSNPVERILRTLSKHTSDIQNFLEKKSIQRSVTSLPMSVDDMVLLLLERGKSSLSQFRKLISHPLSTRTSPHANMESWLQKYYSMVYHPQLSFVEELFYNSIYFPSIMHYSKILGPNNVIVVDIDDFVNRDSLNHYRRSKLKNDAGSADGQTHNYSAVSFRDYFYTDPLHSLFSRIGVPYSEPGSNSHFLTALIADMEKEFILLENDVSYDADRFMLSKDVYRKLVRFFIPFIEILEKELDLNLTNWKMDIDGHAYYHLLPELSYGWNSSRPTLWFESGYSGSEEDDAVDDAKGKIIPHLLPQRTTEEDNGFNTTLGMLNTF